jgi:hypothetical protein
MSQVLGRGNMGDVKRVQMSWCSVAAVACGALLVACSNGSAGDGSTVREPTTPVPTTTPETTASMSASSAARTTETPGHGEGPRTFSVLGVRLGPDDWLAVGIHPTSESVTIEVSPADGVETCRTSVTGTDLRSCTAVDGAGRTVLSEICCSEHIAFAIGHRGQIRATTFTITVSYTAADAYVVITPPVGAGTTTVAFTPRSSTVGTHAYSLPGFGTVADASVAVSQQGHALTIASPCDFAEETLHCVGGVTPGQTAMVSLTPGPSDRKVGLFVTWA